MVRLSALAPLAAVGLCLSAETAPCASSAGPQGGPGIDAGSCLAFDGIDDLVHVVRSVALEPAEITIEMWARLDGPQDWNSRLLRKGEHDAYFITADQDFDQHMQLLVTRGTGQRISAEDVRSHVDYIGTWHHFVGVYATDHAEFWVDGAQVSSVVHGLGALTHLPLTDLYIGAGLPVTLQNEYFAGRIDEVRIWDHARTASEIQHDWNGQVPTASPGLVAYWRFDEGSGQVAHDSSPFGHDGELGQSPAAGPDDPAWVVSDAPLGGGTAWILRYCDSTPNSSGLMARMDIVGSLSVPANDSTLLVEHAPAGHHGMFFYGGERFRVPMADGYLCISPHNPGLFRLFPVVPIDATGSARRALDIASLTASGQITPGSTWHFQFWFRDWAAGGTGSNLSDAIEVTFLP